MKHHSTYAASKPDEPAIIIGGSGEIITWRDYDRRANQIAQYFKDIGLKEKDHVAILLENCAAYLDIATAAFDAGLLVTNISTHLKRDEIVYVIDNSESKVLFTSEKYADLAGQLLDSSPRVTHRLMLQSTIPGFDSFEETMARYEGSPIDRFTCRLNPCTTLRLPPSL